MLRWPSCQIVSPSLVSGTLLGGGNLFQREGRRQILLWAWNTWWRWPTKTVAFSSQKHLAHFSLSFTFLFLKSPLKEFLPVLVVEVEVGRVSCHVVCFCKLEKLVDSSSMKCNVNMALVTFLHNPPWIGRITNFFRLCLSNSRVQCYRFVKHQMQTRLV